MRIPAVVNLLNEFLNISQPVMLHGPPGIGKSDVVRQVAANRGIDLLDIRLSQMDPVDLRGIPSVSRERDVGRTTWNVPAFFPMEGEGIIFLDEINAAPQSMQAAAYQLILDRKVGDYTVPPGWNMVAAGNRINDRAIVNQMSTALKNRFAHIDVEVNADDWAGWAYKNNIDTRVIGFVRFRPELLNTLSNENADAIAKGHNAFATPRSWQYLSRYISRFSNKEISLPALATIVGEGTALEFTTYVGFSSALPDFDAILNSPNNSMVPDEPAMLYAVAVGLAAKSTAKNFDAVIKYTLRMPAEFQVLLVKDAVNKTSQLTQTPAFAAWAAKNASVMF